MDDRFNTEPPELPTTEDMLLDLVIRYLMAQDLYEHGMHVDDPTMSAEAQQIMKDADQAARALLDASNN